MNQSTFEPWAFGFMLFNPYEDNHYNTFTGEFNKSIGTSLKIANESQIIVDTFIDWMEREV